MIVIADSGSTKTHWSFLASEYPDIITEGINPYYRNSKDIYSLIKSAFADLDAPVTQVYFFGAGCNSVEQNTIVKDAINVHWPNASVNIDSDLKAVCYATSQTTEGICCILGTGANSCYFNGKDIEENISPLGYILGDEGSGAYLGKEFVNALYKGRLSAELKTKFEAEFNCDIHTILNKVYKQPLANKYLASFVPFIKAHINDVKLSQLLADAFGLFLKNNVLQYAKSQSLPIHFVGSIAYYFIDILKLELQKYGLQIGEVQQSPMEGLKLYYKKTLQ